MPAGDKGKSAAQDFPAVGPFSGTADGSGAFTTTVDIESDPATMAKINLKIRDRVSADSRKAHFSVTVSKKDWIQALIDTQQGAVGDAPFSKKNVGDTASADLKYLDGDPCVEPVDVQCAPNYSQPAAALSMSLKGSLFQVTLTLSQYKANDQVSGWIYLVPDC